MRHGSSKGRFHPIINRMKGKRLTGHYSMFIRYAFVSLVFAALAGCGFFPAKRLESSSHLINTSVVITDPVLNQRAMEILQLRCASCHGPQSSGLGGGFYSVLDVNQMAVNGLIVPQSSAHSRLYTRIASGSMPLGATMPASEIQTIQSWIDTGMQWGVAPSPSPSPTPSPSIQVGNGNWNYVNNSILKSASYNCIVCHKSGGSAADFTSYTKLVAVGDVVANSPLTSRLYIRTLPGGGMPQGNSTGISPTDSRALFDWITAGAQDNPPIHLVYPSVPTMIVGTPINLVSPSYQGGTATSFSSIPILPSGLTLGTTDGSISGIPTAAAVATNYVITASNSGGSTSATASITVASLSSNGAPTNLIYSNQNPTYGIGAVITPNVPSAQGSPITQYSVSSSLPAGLTMSATTGVITGAPTTTQASTVYTITGANSFGPATTTLQIVVSSNILYTTPDSALRNTTRYYVANVLLGIFGGTPVDSNVNTLVNALILNQPGIFGGPCHNYSMAPNTAPGDYINGDCGNVSANTQLSVMPADNSGREAARIRVCKQVLSLDPAVLNAASLVRSAKISSTTITTPTASDLQGAMNLFHPGTPSSAFSPNEITKLSNLVSAASTPVNQWRLVLLTLCISPDWQVP